MEQLLPEMAEFRSTSTRLHPRPGAPTVEESSVGGPFLWPAGEPWPVCREPHKRRTGERPADVRRRRRILAEAWGRPQGSQGPTDEERDILKSLRRGRHAPWLGDTDPIPLMALAQLYSRDVPDLKPPAGCDLLQILWCPFNTHGEERNPGVRLHWRDSRRTDGPWLDAPEPEVVGSESYVPEPCVTHPERVTEHQYGELLPPHLQERLAEREDFDDDIAVRYQYDLSIPPGWKVGGFASWHLSGPPDRPLQCTCGEPLELLLTIDSSEWDGGTRSWVPVEDQGIVDDPEANRPTQITVGRSGILMFFVCPADHSHPHRLIVQ
ncbi:hypothetical protein [Streptomyces sp. NPDC058665]|uniref:hypothetical protein n=1 Tax=Streptomyces sp. NPDC058665 TaxID=3346586 RepID=UPI003663E795